MVDVIETDVVEEVVVEAEIAGMIMDHLREKTLDGSVRVRVRIGIEEVILHNRRQPGLEVILKDIVGGFGGGLEFSLFGECLFIVQLFLDEEEYFVDTIQWKI